MKHIALVKRLLELSHKHRLSHLGSCLTALPIINDIHERMGPDDRFVLSSGHAGLALYVVLEKFFGADAEILLRDCGVHPDRLLDTQHMIHCSTGSLGQGLPIAVGMAYANKNHTIHCLISDGECAEGSIWEALNLADQLVLPNLKIHLNYNGLGAYREISPSLLTKLQAFSTPINLYTTNVNQFPFLEGLDAHYHVMTDEEYAQAVAILEEQPHE